jgi:hypothetical protein
MRVKDERVWAEQLVELDADDQCRRFRDFLLEWVGAAELLVSGCKSPPPARAALESTLAVVESQRGWLSVEWLSQMLLLLVQHWDCGEDLWGSLSVLERRMVEQVTAMKLAELQQSAEGGAPEVVPEGAVDVEVVDGVDGD